MGKLNPAKLANFLEIEAFVLVACPENSVLDAKEFVQQCPQCQTSKDIPARPMGLLPSLPVPTSGNLHRSTSLSHF